MATTKRSTRSKNDKTQSRATRSGTGKRSQKTRRMQNKQVLPGVVAAITILAVIFGAAWWFFGGGSTMSIQKGMESYLKDKYDKDFVVKRPRLQGTGIAITGSWRAEAHPKDNESLIFEVGRLQEKEQFFDSYTSAVWKEEERPRVEVLLKSLYQQAPSFDLNVGIPSAQAPNPIRGTVPSIATAIKEHGNNFFYSLSLKLKVSTLNSKEKAAIRANFNVVHDFIKKKDVKLPSLTFAVSVADEDAGYLCRTEFDDFDSVDKVFKNCLEVQNKKGVY